MKSSHKYIFYFYPNTERKKGLFLFFNKEDVPKSSSFDVFMFHNVRGYMKAVNQLIKITAPPKKSREDKFKFEDE